VAAFLRGLGFAYEWADRFRRALATGHRARRIDMERELKSAAQQRRWNEEQINGLLGLLQEHAGYLYAHGHALALAQHVLTQVCAKVNPETAAPFFCDVLNNGGSAHYGLGAAVEEARRWCVVMLGPCVNRSTDRFAVENDALESTTPEGKAKQSVGAIRVPLNAIRGIGAEAARHIIAMRTAFGPFTSLLDFRQRIERGVLDRRGLLALIKLGAFDFTALPRAQLAMAEQVYSATADLLLASDRHPAAIAPLEEGLTELVVRAAGALEWPPEVLAADELAYLGFYTVGRVSPVIIGRWWCLNGRPDRWQRAVAGRLMVVSHAHWAADLVPRQLSHLARGMCRWERPGKAPRLRWQSLDKLFDIAGNNPFPAMPLRSHSDPSLPGSPGARPIDRTTQRKPRSSRPPPGRTGKGQSRRKAPPDDGCGLNQPGANRNNG